VIPRKLGLLPDDGRRPRKCFRPLLAQLTAMRPRGHADLTPFCGPVLDQNEVGSCTTAVLMAIATSLHAAGDPLGFVPSQVIGYQLALRLDRADANPRATAETMPPLHDVGSQLLTMVDVAERFGLCPMHGKVLVGGKVRMSDCAPYNATDEGYLKINDVIACATHVIAGPYELDYPTRLLDAKLALDAGISCAIGGFVDSAYMARDANSPPAGRQNGRDPVGGGHAQELVGYEVDDKGLTRWRIKNSWSEDWGEDGYTWVTDAFISEAWSLFALRAEEL